MTRKLLLFILISLCVSNIQGQILGINQPLFDDLPFFNAQFIKGNKIKSITGSIASKKVRDIIRSKGLDYHYEFNEDGTLQAQLSSNFTNGIKDSSVISYEYDSLLRIAVKRKNDSYGYYSYHYQYDDQNNIISQTYCRDENKYECRILFDLKREFVIASDSFSYHKFEETQTKKIFYNGYGKKFKEQTNTYNELGYLTEEYTKFLIGSNKKKITYEYNEEGRIHLKHIYSNIAEGKKTTEDYSYDYIGNVLEIKYFNNDEHISTKQFLYDKKTMFLTALIIQDVKTEFLRIIKYQYEFFDPLLNLTELNQTPDSLLIPTSE